MKLNEDMNYLPSLIMRIDIEDAFFDEEEFVSAALKTEDHKTAYRQSLITNFI